MTRSLLPAFLLFAGLATAGCGGDGRTPLVLYSPHGRDLLALVEESFEAAYPQIDVRYLDMGSQEIFDRVRTEAANPQCDVWFGGPATIFARAAGSGYLEAYEPTWASAIPAESRHPDHLFTALYRTPPVLVYNEDAVPSEEAPSDWEDLLDERWADKVLIRDPLASGTMRTVFGMVLSQSVRDHGSPDAGFEWLRQLDAQTKAYAQNAALLHQKIIRQEGLVTTWTLTDILIQRERGAPLGYHFPTSGSPIINDSIALIKGGRNPEAAKSFIDWIGEKEALMLATSKAYRLPAREDLSPDELPEWARNAIAELHAAEMDWKMIEENGAEWLETWDRTIRGRGKQ